MPGYLLGFGVREAHRYIDIVLSFKDFSGQYMRQNVDQNISIVRKNKRRNYYKLKKTGIFYVSNKALGSEPTEMCLSRKIAITFSNVIVLRN